MSGFLHPLCHLPSWVRRDNIKFSTPFDTTLRHGIKIKVKGKGKAVPLKARRDPEGSKKLRFPDFVKTAQDGGKVARLKHRPPLPPVWQIGTNV